MSSSNTLNETSTLTLRTASRLHFGLLAFGAKDQRRQFGGLGLMVQSPGLMLRAESSTSFGSGGPLSHRVDEFARLWTQHHQMDQLPRVQITVLQAAPQHAGLGTGTQLGLAVAAMLSAWTRVGMPEKASLTLPGATELAAAVGRGGRSSVGTYGFELGGLILELGKRPTEKTGQLEKQVRIPEAWRIVLWRPAETRQLSAGAGLSGAAERQAFHELPMVPESTTEELLGLARNQVLPAAENGDSIAFGDAIYHYGLAAGRCFAEMQGGPFADPLLEQWVEAVRRRGIPGVGQSSWGPTLFAFADSGAAAEDLARWIRTDLGRQIPMEICISAAADRGAELTIADSAD